MDKTFFIFGAGYTSLAIATKLKAIYGNSIPIFGTTRHKENVPLLQAANITPFVLEDENPLPQMQQALNDTTHLIITAPPQAGSKQLGLPSANLQHYLPKLKWLAYFSTLGVYGDAQGNWVDENSPLKATLDRNVARRDAEIKWQNFANTYPIPATILRLGSIYGGNLTPKKLQTTNETNLGRNAFQRLSSGSARCIIKPDQVFNYIHVEDIAGATCHLAAKKLAGVFNLCDEQPAPPQDVVRFAAELMGKKPPSPEDFATADISQAMRGFYQANRRASNLKLRQTGYEFSFPNYQSGYNKIWHDSNI